MVQVGIKKLLLDYSFQHLFLLVIVKPKFLCWTSDPASALPPPSSSGSPAPSPPPSGHVRQKRGGGDTGSAKYGLLVGYTSNVDISIPIGENNFMIYDDQHGTNQSAICSFFFFYIFCVEILFWCSPSGSLKYSKYQPTDFTKGNRTFADMVVFDQQYLVTWDITSEATHHAKASSEVTPVCPKGTLKTFFIVYLVKMRWPLLMFFLICATIHTKLKKAMKLPKPFKRLLLFWYLPLQTRPSH